MRDARRTAEIHKSKPMSLAAIFKAFWPVDARTIARDALLLVVTAGSLILALFIRLAWPWALITASRLWGLDIGPYHPLLMSLVVLMAPGMAGILFGYLILEERDLGILTVLRVTPLPTSRYLAYRLAMPIAAGFVITLAARPLAGPMDISFGQLVVASGLAALSAANTALALASLAENRVAGIAILKVLQGVQALPLAAYFLEPPLQWVAGIIPTYWPLVVLWRMGRDEPVVAYALVGVILNLLLAAYLTRRFSARY